MSIKEHQRILAGLINENDPVRKVIVVHGVEVHVEWPNGSTRTYPSTGYSRKMSCDYGYVHKAITEEDGEELDCYVGDFDNPNEVYEIKQLIAWKDSDDFGNFDEFKYMIDFKDSKSAKECYIKHMSEDHFGGIKKVPMEDFLKLVDKLKED